MNDLPQFLVRWMCHDLATPIASVMTASELLDDMRDAEINELIQYGTRRLTARLRLLRLALGAADSAMASSALERLVREGLDDTPMEWTFAGDATGGMAALVAGCAMLVADLNRTRALTVTPGCVLVSPQCNWSDSVAAVLAGAPATCNRGSLAAMVMQSAAHAGKRLTHDLSGLQWG